MKLRPFLIVVKKGKIGVKNRLLFEDGAKRHQVSSCLAYFFFFCVKQSSLVLIFGSFYQEKEQAKDLCQYSTGRINSFKIMKIKQLTKYSWFLTASILVIGFLFVYFKLADYGYTFFILFPLSLGFTLGTIFKQGIHIVYMTLGIIAGSSALIAFGLEGFTCVLMFLPIFMVSVASGFFVARRMKLKAERDSNKLLMSVLPLLILIVLGNIEMKNSLEPQIIEIETSVILPYEPEVLFDGVKSMKKLDGEKPFLMKLGLPTPIRCELEANEVGALRHCIFENGEITAQLTHYQKGELLEMDVVDYTLTGRHWFKFIDAKYTFEKSGAKTKITRTSSYKSTLKPRWYWRPLEEIGIAQEHIFVLNSLKKNLEENKSN